VLATGTESCDITGRQGMTNAFKFIGGCTVDVSRAVLDITGLGKIQYY
jgi:hypothetical protein